MKIAITIIRTLMGLLLLFGSVAYFFNLVPQPELTGNMKTFMEGMLASGYLLTMAKVIELICGIAFVTGRYVALAAILIAPIVVNIFIIHLMMDQSGLPVGIFLVLANAFLGYAYWDRYRGLFQPK